MNRETFAILEKTRIGKYFRTTVPEQVRRMLKVKEGDEIIWIQEGDRIFIDRARKKIRMAAMTNDYTRTACEER